MWATILNFGVILIIPVSLAHATKFKLIPNGNKTTYENGVTHQLVKYILLPENSNIIHESNDTETQFVESGDKNIGEIIQEFISDRSQNSTYTIDKLHNEGHHPNHNTVVHYSESHTYGNYGEQKTDDQKSDLKYDDATVPNKTATYHVSYGTTRTKPDESMKIIREFISDGPQNSTYAVEKLYNEGHHFNHNTAAHYTESHMYGNNGKQKTDDQISDLKYNDATVPNKTATYHVTYGTTKTKPDGSIDEYGETWDNQKDLIPNENLKSSYKTIMHNSYHQYETGGIENKVISQGSNSNFIKNVVGNEKTSNDNVQTNILNESNGNKTNNSNIVLTENYSVDNISNLDILSENDRKKGLRSDDNKQSSDLTEKNLMDTNFYDVYGEIIPTKETEKAGEYEKAKETNIEQKIDTNKVKNVVTNNKMNILKSRSDLRLDESALESSELFHSSPEASTIKETEVNPEILRNSELSHDDLDIDYNTAKPDTGKVIVAVNTNDNDDFTNSKLSSDYYFLEDQPKYHRYKKPHNQLQYLFAADESSNAEKTVENPVKLQINGKTVNEGYDAANTINSGLNTYEMSDAETNNVNLHIMSTIPVKSPLHFINIKSNPKFITRNYHSQPYIHNNEGFVGKKQLVDGNILKYISHEHLNSLNNQDSQSYVIINGEKHALNDNILKYILWQKQSNLNNIPEKEIKANLIQNRYLKEGKEQDIDGVAVVEYKYAYDNPGIKIVNKNHLARKNPNRDEYSIPKFDNNYDNTSQLSNINRIILESNSNYDLNAYLAHKNAAEKKYNVAQLKEFLIKVVLQNKLGSILNVNLLYNKVLNYIVYLESQGVSEWLIGHVIRDIEHNLLNRVRLTLERQNPYYYISRSKYCSSCQ